MHIFSRTAIHTTAYTSKHYFAVVWLDKPGFRASSQIEDVGFPSTSRAIKCLFSVVAMKVGRSCCSVRGNFCFFLRLQQREWDWVSNIDLFLFHVCYSIIQHIFPFHRWWRLVLGIFQWNVRALLCCKLSDHWVDLAVFIAVIYASGIAQHPFCHIQWT